MGIVQKVLEELKKNLKNNEIFLSEADLQFSFAQKLYELNNEDNNYEISDIILEYPIMTNELYKGNDVCIEALKNCYKNSNRCKNCDKWNNEKCKIDFYERINEKPYVDADDNLIKDLKAKNECSKLDTRFKQDRTFIDLAFTCNKVQYFIEFKYKTSEANVKRYNKDFTLKQQGAEDYARHAIYEDIERMENIKNILPCKSFVIFLTNEKKYWEKNPDKDKLASNMPLAPNSSNFQILKGIHPYIKHDKDGYRKTIYLQNSYSLSTNFLNLDKNSKQSGWFNWFDFKKTNNDNSENLEFKCLIIAIPSKQEEG